MNKNNTVLNMVSALEEYAESKGVSLKDKIPDYVNKFDDLFVDGGEGRCEHFVDLSFDYAQNFGIIEDYSNPKGFEAHIWMCINPAMEKRKKWGSATN
jgi:hypothetical protein